MKLAAALLLAAAAALGQEEPTPFWMPPPPPKEKPAKKKPPKPAKKRPAPATPAPSEPSTERVEKPRPHKPAPQTPSWIEVTPPPEPVVRKPVTPAPLPVRPAPQPEPEPSQPLAAPVPHVITPPPAPPIAAPPIAEPPAPVIAAEPEEEQPASADIRNWSFDLVGGGWAKSRSDGSGRSWDLAYGVRGSYGFFGDSLEAELLIARAGGTSGSPFVSTTAIHNLAMARAFWVLGDRVALLLGGGGGIALAQTHYTLVDVISGNSSGLDATAVKTVIGITAAGRFRVFRGLQARLEVSGILRDGRVEFLPLLGLGWAL